jgi:hypothetical protein
MTDEQYIELMPSPYIGDKSWQWTYYVGVGIVLLLDLKDFLEEI